MFAFSAPPLSLTTPRFLLRSLNLGDINDRWIGWAADPEVMAVMHSRTRKLSRDALAGYIARFDDVQRFLIGIFDRSTGHHIGLHTAETDVYNGVVGFNVLIGEQEYWGRNVVVETGAALIDHFFEARSMEKATARVSAGNYRILFSLNALGWRLEGVLRQQVLSANGTRADQCLYGLQREEWRARKQERST